MADKHTAGAAARLLPAAEGDRYPDDGGNNAIPLSQEDHQALMKRVARELPAFARCAGLAR